MIIARTPYDGEPDGRSDFVLRLKLGIRMV